ncbi:hypothetical protein [Paenibacillus uliginis]|uniref:hypothetical protein n=1 Tax=Paenibacillus uliginis TaxID=683737 RepID=UPI001AD7F5DF|nr:hypothetical protein [Paenibacillus uliginis]
MNSNVKNYCMDYSAFNRITLGCAERLLETFTGATGMSFAVCSRGGHSSTHQGNPYSQGDSSLVMWGWSTWSRHRISIVIFNISKTLYF